MSVNISITISSPCFLFVVMRVNACGKESPTAGTPKNPIVGIPTCSFGTLHFNLGTEVANIKNEVWICRKLGRGSVLVQRLISLTGCKNPSIHRNSVLSVIASYSTLFYYCHRSCSLEARLNPLSIIERLAKKQINHNVQRNVLIILLICGGMTGLTVGLSSLFDIIFGFSVWFTLEGIKNK